MTDKKILMLDRDGTINARIRNGYLLKSKDIRRPPDLDSLLKLEALGFEINVITNQACISKKLISLIEVRNLTKEILSPILEISDSQIFICEHQALENCHCRKPESKLVFDCLEYHGAESRSAFFIGDSATDSIAAAAAGVKFLGVCWDSECLGFACSHTLEGAVEAISATIKRKGFHERTV